MRKSAITVVAALACAGVVAGPSVSAFAGSTPAKATVCSGTLSGAYDQIVVPDGATCTLDGATVAKGVTAGTNSSLFTMNASIGGNVMTRGAYTVQIVDTSVGLNIDVTGTTHLTKIGDARCAVDPTIGHNVMVKSNSGPTAICSLDIGNNLALFDNTGSVGVFRNHVDNNLLVFRNSGKGTRVRYNTVGINLNCSDNTSGKFKSVGNTVGGSAMGQCA